MYIQMCSSDDLGTKKLAQNPSSIILCGDNAVHLFARSSRPQHSAVLYLPAKLWANDYTER